jgi:hypothetical protein
MNIFSLEQKNAKRNLERQIKENEMANKKLQKHIKFVIDKGNCRSGIIGHFKWLSENIGEFYWEKEINNENYTEQEINDEIDQMIKDNIIVERTSDGEIVVREWMPETFEEIQEGNNKK